jgi:hypothetical protein
MLKRLAWTDPLDNLHSAGSDNARGNKKRAAELKAAAAEVKRAEEKKAAELEKVAELKAEDKRKTEGKKKEEVDDTSKFHTNVSICCLGTRVRREKKTGCLCFISRHHQNTVFPETVVKKAGTAPALSGKDEVPEMHSKKAKSAGMNDEDDDDDDEPMPDAKTKKRKGSPSEDSSEPKKKFKTVDTKSILLEKIVDYRDKIEHETFPPVRQPSWNTKFWRRKVGFDLDRSSMTITFKSAVWERHKDFKRGVKTDWRDDTIEAMAQDHELVTAALANLLRRFHAVLRSGKPIRASEWGETTADGAKTRSGTETKLASLDTDAIIRYPSVHDLISDVSYTVTQKQDTLCLANACVNGLSGVVSLEQIMEYAWAQNQLIASRDHDRPPTTAQIRHYLTQNQPTAQSLCKVVPSLGQIRQYLDTRGIETPFPACFQDQKYFKDDSPFSPIECLAVFANAVQSGGLVGRFAVKVAGAHWLTIVARPGGAVIIDSDPSHPVGEPVAFTRGKLLEMGYSGIYNIWQMVLTRRPNKLLKKLQAVQAKLR